MSSVTIHRGFHHAVARGLIDQLPFHKKYSLFGELVVEWWAVEQAAKAGFMMGCGLPLADPPAGLEAVELYLGGDWAAFRAEALSDFQGDGPTFFSENGCYDPDEYLTEAHDDLEYQIRQAADFWPLATLKYEELFWPPYEEDKVSKSAGVAAYFVVHRTLQGIICGLKNREIATTMLTAWVSEPKQEGSFSAASTLALPRPLGQATVDQVLVMAAAMYQRWRVGTQPIDTPWPDRQLANSDAASDIEAAEAFTLAGVAEFELVLDRMNDWKRPNVPRALQLLDQLVLAYPELDDFVEPARSELDDYSLAGDKEERHDIWYSFLGESGRRWQRLADVGGIDPYEAS